MTSDWRTACRALSRYSLRSAQLLIEGSTEHAPRRDRCWMVPWPGSWPSGLEIVQQVSPTGLDPAFRQLRPALPGVMATWELRQPFFRRLVARRSRLGSAKR